MKVKLTTEFVRRLPLANIDIYDIKYPGLVLRCRTSGSHSYRVAYGRGKWVTLGRSDVLTPDEARGKARDELSAIAKGRDPRAERIAAAASATTLRDFVDQSYEPWALANLKRGKETVQRIRTVFAPLLDTKLSGLTAWTVEKWRTERLREEPSPKPTTLNDYIILLKGLLNKAVEWKALTTGRPIRKGEVKLLKTDKNPPVRFLSRAEELRLRKALTARDKARRARRQRSNAWRRERGYAEWPADNADHLTPVVLLALNTGLRKGEIFELMWSDIDLVSARLTVRGEVAKSAQTRYVPLNTEVVDVLTRWRATRSDQDGYAFAGRTDSGDGRLNDVKKAWTPLLAAASVKTFRFHDLRHTFASNLVMRGVDLNTVRELLGHSDIKMTLRYAHLAPEHKVAAVARLVSA